MNSASRPVGALEERIQEFNLIEQRIEQQIEFEQGRAEPDAEMVRRLKQERLNLKDTLERAKRWADQKAQSDLSAA